MSRTKEFFIVFTLLGLLSLYVVAGSSIHSTPPTDYTVKSFNDNDLLSVLRKTLAFEDGTGGFWVDEGERQGYSRELVRNWTRSLGSDHQRFFSGHVAVSWAFLRLYEASGNNTDLSTGLALLDFVEEHFRNTSATGFAYCYHQWINGTPIWCSSDPTRQVTYLYVQSYALRLSHSDERLQQAESQTKYLLGHFGSPNYPLYEDEGQTSGVAFDFDEMHASSVAEFGWALWNLYQITSKEEYKRMAYRSVNLLERMKDTSYGGFHIYNPELTTVNNPRKFPNDHYTPILMAAQMLNDGENNQSLRDLIDYSQDALNKMRWTNQLIYEMEGDFSLPAWSTPVYNTLMTGWALLEAAKAYDSLELYQQGKWYIEQLYIRMWDYEEGGLHWSLWVEAPSWSNSTLEEWKTVEAHAYALLTLAGRMDAQTFFAPVEEQYFATQLIGVGVLIVLSSLAGALIYRRYRRSKEGILVTISPQHTVLHYLYSRITFALKKLEEEGMLGLQAERVVEDSHEIELSLNVREELIQFRTSLPVVLLLELAEKHPEAGYVTEIATHLKLSKSRISKNVEKLLQRGFIKRHITQKEFGDTRLRGYAITTEGILFLYAVKQEVEEYLGS